MSVSLHHRKEQNGRPRIGLALGGGSARGFTHLGVLSVLEEAGIPIDVVAGTSAGSLMGAFYSSGMSLHLIDQFAQQMSWRRAARPVLSTNGFICLDPMAAWIRDILGELYIEDLVIPFACAATDMRTGQAVVLNSGPLASAVQASCSIPGIITPVILNGRLLCDGGITNNVPVSIARQLGADYVIGVDIFEPNLQWPSLGPLGRGLAALEIMIEHAGSGTKTADCLIAPELSGYSYIRFSCRQELIALGRQAALRCLPTITQVLQHDR
jgi:NTE family protein